MMQNKFIILGIILIVFLLGVLAFGGKIIKKPEIKKTSPVVIRVGWQTPWATQGQLTQILKNTDILEKNGLKGDFKGFASGAPLNEAALARNVDIIFTADQPAATLLSKNSNWVIIGRLMNNRVTLYIPPNSPIKEVSDLKGKTVGMPFGAAAQRMAIEAEEKAGLDPKLDVNNVNLGIYEQSDLVRDPNATNWGDIDALAGFDPTPAIFEDKGLVRNLAVGKVTSVIMMNKDFIKKHPEAPKQFLTAFSQDYDYYRTHIDQANNWFIAESKLKASPKSLKIASSVEPNLMAKSKDEIRLGFNDEDYSSLQNAADFIFKQGLIKKKVDMKQNIDMSYLESANLR